MAPLNFENFHETWYQGVFRVTEHEFMVNIQKAYAIWRLKFKKFSKFIFLK